MAVAAMILTSALWALTFVAPMLLPEVSSFGIAGLRYGVFGAGAVALWLTREAGGGHGPGVGGDIDWRRAALHGLTGNIGHYVLAVLAVRVAGAPVTVSVIALIPIAYGLLGARQEGRERGHAGRVDWRSLGAPLGLTAAGIVAVDLATLQTVDAPSVGALVAGILLAGASGGAWLWYGLDTARHLRATGISASRWTNAVGVATAPLALPLLVIGFAGTGGNGAALRIGPIVVVALVLGMGSSWVGTAGFNYASARLPRHLLAPLMALEPAWTLVLAHAIDGRMPTPLQAVGEALLVAGAAVALRCLRSRTEPARRRQDQGTTGDTPRIGRRERLQPDPARGAA